VSDEGVTFRAERLRVLLAVIGEEPSMDPGESFERGPMPRGWHHYMPSDAAAGLDPGSVRDDVGLAIECANLAKEVRAREWEALECFDALMNGVPAGVALPDPDKRRLVDAIVTLGWNRFPEEG